MYKRQALGNAKISLFLAVLRKIILLIPFIYILPNFFADKAFAVFLAEPVADFLAVCTTATTVSYTHLDVYKSKTQILADMMTIEEHCHKPLNQVKVVFPGDVRNNLCLLYTSCSPGWRNGTGSPPAPSPAANSRCWRWAGP